MPKQPDKVIQPIPDTFENVTKKVVNPRTSKPKEIKVLVPAAPPKSRTSMQGNLDLQIEKQIEVDGVGMGVLTDGTAFLNGRGLARLCGIDSSRISEMSADWNDANLALTSKVKEILGKRGVTRIELFV